MGLKRKLPLTGRVKNGLRPLTPAGPIISGNRSAQPMSQSPHTQQKSRGSGVHVLVS